MLYPSIQKCVEKVGDKYTLAVIAAKRSLELKEKMPAEFVGKKTKEISYALSEVREGKVVRTNNI